MPSSQPCTGQDGSNSFTATGVFEGFITEAEYARQRGVSLRTCQRDRALRKAPPHVVIGRTVYYRVDSIRQWLAAKERHSDRTLRRRDRPR